MSVAPSSFQNRKSLPKAWLGLRDKQLSKEAGIPDCVFVHANGAALAHCASVYKCIAERSSLLQSDLLLLCRPAEGSITRLDGMPPDWLCGH